VLDRDGEADADHAADAIAPSVRLTEREDKARRLSVVGDL